MYGTPPDDRTLVFLTNNRSGSGVLRQALIEEYGLDNIFMFGVLDERGEMTGSIDDLYESAEAGRHRIYYGHLPYGLHARMPGEVEYVVTVRDPVERVLSLYDAYSRRDDDFPRLAEWIGAAPDANDGMVKRMCGLQPWDGRHDHYDFVADQALDADPEITERHLEAALETVGTGVVVLSQGHHAENLVLLQRRYRTAPLFSLLLHNVGRLSDTPRRDAADADDMAIVEQHNRLDIRFYERLIADYERALAAAPADFHEDVRIMKLIVDIIVEPGVHQIDQERLHQRIAVFAQAWEQMGKSADAVAALKRIVRKRNLAQVTARMCVEAIERLGSDADAAEARASYAGRFGDDGFNP